ncbi:MAG: DUF6491 family protein [Caulobacteraceae bacterium]
MKKLLTALSSLFALWTLAACATDESASQVASSNDCFRSADVNGYTVIDDRHVGLRVGANRNYVLTTSWNVRDLDWTQAIAVRTATGRICTGNGLGVELIGGDPQRTYPVVSIERAPEDPAPQGS